MNSLSCYSTMKGSFTTTLEAAQSDFIIIPHPNYPAWQWMWSESRTIHLRRWKQEHKESLYSSQLGLHRWPSLLHQSRFNGDSSFTFAPSHANVFFFKLYAFIFHTLIIRPACTVSPTDRTGVLLHTQSAQHKHVCKMCCWWNLWCDHSVLPCPQKYSSPS